MGRRLGRAWTGWSWWLALALATTAGALALLAGCDVLLTCGPAANSESVFGSLVRRAETDVAFRKIIEQACNKVKQAKRDWDIGKAAPDVSNSVRELAFSAQQLNEQVNSSLGARGLALAWKGAASLQAKASAAESSGSADSGGIAG